MQLKCVSVRDDVLNKILYDYEAKVIEIESLEDKSYYRYRKNVIYVKSTKEVICSGYILNSRCGTDLSPWLQVKCVPSTNTDSIIEDSIDGQTAWNCVMKALERHYSRDAIESVLKAFWDAKEHHLKQFHYTLQNVRQGVRLVPHCVKYDINGAHADALRSMFPLAERDLLRLYRKSKKYVNFFVGMLKRKGYEGAYWHIVDRTTKILLKAMEEVGGKLIYANTDGFCVQNPDRMLKASHELGEFKLEYEGDVHFYQNNKESPYFLYQFGDDKKGNCMTEVRDMIDLRKGEIVYYNRVSHGTYVTPENIHKEKEEIYE